MDLENIILIFALSLFLVVVIFMLIPKRLHRRIEILFSRKYKAVIVKKKIRKAKYITYPKYSSAYSSDAIYYTLDVCINNQTKRYYCADQDEFKKIPIGQELIIYVIGKTILQFK